MKRILCLAGCKSDKAADKTSTDDNSTNDIKEEFGNNTDDNSGADAVDEDLAALSEEFALSIIEIGSGIILNYA
jgi:hypothetical protein